MNDKHVSALVNWFNQIKIIISQIANVMLEVPGYISDDILHVHTNVIVKVCEWFDDNTVKPVCNDHHYNKIYHL